MPAPPLVNTFAGGTDTVDISAANSGGASGNAFDNVIAGTSVTVKYSATQARPNSGFSANFIQPVTGATSYLLWQGLGSITTSVFFRMYINMSLNNVGTAFYAPRDAADAASGYCLINSTGKLAIQNAAGTTQAGATSTTTMPTGQWWRLEYRILPSTTVGEIEYRVFLAGNVEGFTADETHGATGQILTANVDKIRQGVGVTSGLTGSNQNAYIANVGVSTVDWLGPYQAVPQVQKTQYKRMRRYTSYR